MATTSNSLFHRPWFPGLVLLCATFVALIVANTGLSELYGSVLNTKLKVQFGDLGFGKPLILWINDGLMALFFLLVGLELKRECQTGHLKKLRDAMLPFIGAIGGMAIPALVYLTINYGDPVASKGWAIPAATDIAFALSALAVIGSGIPASLKIFLMALAIFDDIGAILIIALFYSSSLSMNMLYIAVGLMVILYVFNLMKVRNLAPYLFIGTLLWFAVLKSGVHATLAGVVLAFFIPSSRKEGKTHSPSDNLEHALHGFCMFIVLPIFALANAGLTFEGHALVESLLHPVPLGIALGLTVGKMVGIFGFICLGIFVFKLKLPRGANWGHILGVACLCGIGFTMSLFIGSLAFEQGGPAYDFDERLGILVGSLISAIMGIVILKITAKKSKQA